MNKKPNHSIHCNVQNCRHICGESCYCSLDAISVGCGTGSANTLCCSFEEQRGSRNSAERAASHAFESALDNWGTDVYGPAESLMENYPGTVDNRSDSANTTDSHTFPW